MSHACIASKSSFAVRQWRAGLFATLLLASFALLCNLAGAQTLDPVVARVAGVEIRQSDLRIAEEDIGHVPGATPQARRDYLVLYVSDLILAARAAESKKLVESRDLKRRLSYAHNKLLTEALLRAESKRSLNDAALRAAYDELAKRAAEMQEVRVRHILVETEEQAKTILAEIKNGKDFAEAAKEKSRADSARAGGDLGYLLKEAMPREITKQAFKLEKGEVSEPIKTAIAWHVIKVEDKRSRRMPEFENVKAQIEFIVARRAQAALIGKLRDGAKVELADRKPAPAKDGRNEK